MLRFSLNDSILLNVFLPGAIVLAGIGWLCFPWIWALLEPGLNNSFQSGKADLSGVGLLIAVTGFLAFFVSLFLGSLIGVILGYLEYYALDLWQARRLKIGYDEYLAQWNRYVDSLEKAHNSYVTKQVNAFLFQARSGAALLVAAVLVAASSFHPTIVWTVMLAFAFFLLQAAVDDHRMLAEFRKRRFAVKPESTTKPEESLRALIDGWCKRAEVRPLQLVLTAISADGRTILDPAKTSDILQRVAELPDSEVLPSEKCVLSLIIAALTERARPKV